MYYHRFIKFKINDLKITNLKLQLNLTDIITPKKTKLKYLKWHTYQSLVYSGLHVTLLGTKTNNCVHQHKENFRKKTKVKVITLKSI